MILGNESNNDYIAQIIKIEECCTSELTIWEASGLAAGALSRLPPHGEDSRAEEPPPPWGPARLLPLLGDLAVSLRFS